MLGIAIGIVFGLAQFYLLLIGVRSVGSDHLRLVPLVGQFLCPFAGLLLCAFLDRGHLLVCAVIIIAILLIGAAVNFYLFSRGNNKK